MSAVQYNKQIITEYFNHYWGKGDVSIVDKLCAPNYLIHYPMHGPRYGREASKKMLTEFREAFPDLTFWAVGPLIGENVDGEEYIVGRWDGGGTHTGRAFDDLRVGKLDRPNTGKKIRFTGTTVFKMKNGLIQEEIGEEGALDALQQMDLIPKY